MQVLCICRFCIRCSFVNEYGQRIYGHKVHRSMRLRHEKALNRNERSQSPSLTVMELDEGSSEDEGVFTFFLHV